MTPYNTWFFLLVHVGAVVLMIGCTNNDSKGKPDIDKREYYRHLPQEGDYSKLEFIIKPNKNKYLQGEPIFICCAVRNTSDSSISLNQLLAPVFLGAQNVDIFDARNEKVPLTQFGKKSVESFAALYRGDADRAYYRSQYLFAGTLEGLPNGEFVVEHHKHYTRILPGEELDLETQPISLYFDMTDSGKYQITLYRKTLMHGQKFDPPLKSNTIEIEVENSVFTINGLHDRGEFADRPTKNNEKSKDN